MREEKFLKRIILEKNKSLIHGNGIFSKTIIPKNKIFYVVPLKSFFVKPVKNCARIYSNFFVNDEKVLNYVNHSCEPNAEIVIESNRVVLRSIKSIKLGEEITVDYCENEEKNNLIECSCKSKNCRNYFFIT